VIISPDGYILTANHVVDGADEVKVALATGGKEYTAKIVGTDPPTDVAVLKISAEDLPAITMADSDKLEVGDVVLAIGNPFRVGQTVTQGIISALGRSSLALNRYEDFIQTDAAINPGNSGGALVDAEGRLVGINTAIFSPMGRQGGNVGIGFAVPANLARGVMERLMKDGKVTRGFLGILPQDVTPDLMEEFKLPDQAGALVGSVSPETPAEQAGLENGDVIREVDGKKITDSKQFRLMISQTAPGTKVTLKLLRSEVGQKPVEKTVTVTLDTLKDGLASRDGRGGPGERGVSKPDSLEGVEVADLDPPTRRQFGIPRQVSGALVTRVEEDSNAAGADLRQGDVIQEINRQPVRNAEDAVDLSDKAKGDRVMLRIWREGVGLYITVDNTKK
jgi:serine protease Do